MKNKPILNTICTAFAAAAGLFASAVSSHAQGVTATISDVAVAGGYDYTIVLTDSGSTSINSFWYAWTQSGNNLTTLPSSAGNSLGWGNAVQSGPPYSIEWVNSTGTTLNPGNSGSFTFFSTTTPTDITTAPSGESVAYVNGIDFSQGTPGDSTGVFSPTLTTVPEPSSIALLAAGALGLLVTGWRRFRAIAR